MSELTIYAIGFVAQILFFSRMVVQWIHSEKVGKPISPTLFWQLSILGSILFMIYGLLRDDFVIILGQFLVYFIYVRNLHLKQQWTILPIPMRIQFFLIPLFIMIYGLLSGSGSLTKFFSNGAIPDWLMIWGILAQFIFTGRFFVQWIESERQEQSVLSPIFWTISLAGSLMIILYAIFRNDPVLLAGQSFGAVLYLRNFMLASKSALKLNNEAADNTIAWNDQK